MPLSQPISSIRKELQKLVVNDLPAALIMCKELLPENTKKFNLVLAMQANLNQLSKDRIKGLITQEEYGRRIAIISDSCIDFIADLQEADFNPPLASNAAPGKTNTAQLGSVLYQVPRHMPLGKPNFCKIRVAIEEDAILEDIVIDNDVRIRERVEVSDRMSAELVDTEGKVFDIQSLNSKDQNVRLTGYTQWLFRVMPLVEGEHHLLVKVSLLEFDKNTREYIPRDVSVLETVTVVTATHRSDDDGETPMKSAGAPFVMGPFKDEALAKLDSIEEKKIWDQVPKNRQTALLRYIQQNQQSPYVTEARRLLDESRNAPATLAPKEVKRKEQPVLPPVPASIIGSKLTIPEHMVLVKGGTFEMGDVMGDKENDDETVHTVRLSNFLLAKNELTFNEYDAFCKATGRELPGDEGWGRGKRPVINVDWYDAVEYCNWRSGQEGLQEVYSINKNSKDSKNSNVYDNKKWLVTTSRRANGYRLPTEAEWEYAARQGGQKVRFGNGKDIADPKEINFDASSRGKKAYSVVGEYRQKTLPVGSFSSNTLDLFDMSGNVWEWCGDWYGTYPSGASNDPQGATGGSGRVIRGGSWGNYPANVRVADRYDDSPDYRFRILGFRLARQQ